MNKKEGENHREWFQIKYDKGFNKSSKVLEHKLGINAARLLETLIYKYNYWKEEEGLIDIQGKKGFFITIPNLIVETNMTKSPIQKAIKKLKDEGLVEVHLLGIPAKNHYILNIPAIEKLEKEHSPVFQDWCERVYEEAKTDRSRFDKIIENTAEPLCLKQMDVLQPTSGTENSQLDVHLSSVTNNKTTNNKTPRTFTNRINADHYFDHEEELTKLIDQLKGANYNDRDKEINEVYCFLKSRILQFHDFKPSDNDTELILELADSSQHSFCLADKICANGKAIMKGSKKARFGNLFVGIDMIEYNMGLKYG